MRDMNKPRNAPGASERRSQSRIQVKIPVQVSLPGVAEPVPAVNQDISWGGALFVLPQQPPLNTGAIRIVLPWRQHETITADAHILRAKTLQDGSCLVAARFFSLTPRSHSRLERLLKLLQGGGGDISGGLVRELEVTANDNDDLRQMLMQIATGRYSVTVFDAYELDQSIKLSVAGTTGSPGIRLRARVVDIRKAASRDNSWSDLYTLTLAFEHPRRSIRSFVDLFLNNLPEAKATEEKGDSELSMLADAPYWVRASTFASPTSADLAFRSGRTGTPCVLETDFPEALNRLTAGWGDIQAFEVMFRDLVLGDQGNPGGWPADAWDELEFLQSVHDIAYGMSESRRSLLKIGRLI